jgi:hypothetical protein
LTQGVQGRLRCARLTAYKRRSRHRTEKRPALVSVLASGNTDGILSTRGRGIRPELNDTSRVGTLQRAAVYPDSTVYYTDTLLRRNIVSALATCRGIEFDIRLLFHRQGVIDIFFPSLAVNSSTLSINQDKLLPRAWQTPGKRSRTADPTNHIHCSEFSYANLSDRKEQSSWKKDGTRFRVFWILRLTCSPRDRPRISTMSRTGAPFLTSVSYPPNGAPGRVLRYTPYHGSCRDLLMSQSRGLDSIYKTCGLFIRVLFFLLHQTGPDPNLRAMLC